jgi:hypothetical protein
MTKATNAMNELNTFCRRPPQVFLLAGRAAMMLTSSDSSGQMPKTDRQTSPPSLATSLAA